jgi:alkylation response protein AidB-like acyl-CoA dehydrogenase
MHVYLHGSEEMRSELMPRIISGEAKLAICLTEPDTGSDAAGIKTFAKPDGDDFVINGQKIYNSGVHVAQHIVLVTRTDPDAHGHKGMSMFLVDTDAPGITIQRLDGMGRRTVGASHSFFEDVRVPARNLIGTMNEGWHDLMDCLNLERLCLAAMGVGNIERFIDYSRDYALQRVQFGRPIAKFQAIAHKFADMEVMWQTARNQVLAVAEMIDAGLDPVTETAVAKLYATESCWRAADLAMQIMGGAGFILDYTMQRMFRDARVGTIGGGTSEIQRNVIAKQMGL